MNLGSCTALVTGGAIRIGRAICEALADRGCGVIVHYQRSAGEAESLVHLLRDRGGRAFRMQGALESERGAAGLVDEAWSAAGGFNILVNNASVFNKDALPDVTEEKLIGDFRVNLLAPMVLTRAFAARVRRAGAGEDGGPIAGKIVNLLDRRIAGLDTQCIPYVLSKKALAEFTRLAALELAPSITVNGVAPGAILPPSTRRPAGQGSSGTISDLAGPAPLRHACTPADVARAVVFLLEEDAITGQVLYVDAGQHLLGPAARE